MKAGPPAVCCGQVLHRRYAPAHHEFRYDVSYLWFDPGNPAALADHHPLWSATRPSPARFRSRDYGDGTGRTLDQQVRAELAEILPEPVSEVRMLTQWRRWGWLFNPITISVAWGDDPTHPMGVVLEVTNTPWKERHRYPLRLDEVDGLFTTRFAKELHVSPFLDENHEYRLWLGGDDHRIEVRIDVVTPGTDDPILTTRLDLDLVPADRASLTRALLTPVAPTHRVSVGIHTQAARLAARRVPFVPHPRSRKVAS